MKSLPDKDGEQVQMTKMGLMYLQLFIPWALASIIWGFVFSQTSIFLIAGFIIGLFACLMTATALYGAKTAEEHREIVFAAGSLWGPLSFLIGIAGLIAFIIKTIF